MTNYHFLNTKINLKILYQEISAEKRVAILRMFFTFLFFMRGIIEAILLNRPLLSYPLPFFITFIISIAVYIEVSFMLKHDIFREMKILYKYIVILIDIFSFSYAIYYSFIILEGQSPFGSQTELAFVVSLTFCILLILFVDVFRFNSYSSYYIGVVGSIFIVLFSTKFITGNYFDIEVFFKNYIYISTLVMVNISAIISGLVSKFFHSVIVKSWRQEQLERYLPTSVANDILNGDEDIDLGGKRKKVTILFSDIRNFTAMSENAEPEEVIDFLNSYFDKMIRIIFKHNGSLDKIIGDGIMAIFGLTGDNKRDEEMATLSAIDMVEKLRDFNNLRETQGKKAIDIGIGIHTGEVIVGNVGSKIRMEFTAIGDTVNTASRLQDLTKKEDTKIIVSENIVKALPSFIQYKPLGEANLKGKKEPMKIFGIE